MAKFVKKSDVVEAFKFDIDVEPTVWIRKEIECGNAWVEHSINKAHTKLFIRTLEGLIYQVNIGDYIIQGVKGEIYPCKADMFEMTYEKVDKERVKKSSLEFSAKLELDTKDFHKNIENVTKEIETFDEAVDRLEKKMNRIFAKENKVDIDRIVKQLEERLREGIK